MADTADTADTKANTANILARYRREADATSVGADRNSAAANRQNTATGPAKTGEAAETGEAVIGAAIGGMAVTGAAAADSSLSAEVIRTTGIGTHIGAGVILTRTTAIILRIGTPTTVAPYQDTDTLGPDPLDECNNMFVTSRGRRFPTDSTVSSAQVCCFCTLTIDTTAVPSKLRSSAILSRLLL
jgi:hypothetical protein